MKRIVPAILAIAVWLLPVSAVSAHEEGPASVSHLFLMHPFDGIDPLLLVALIGFGVTALWLVWRAKR